MWNIFKKKKRVSFVEIEMEVEKLSYVWKQQAEDRRLEQLADRQAFELYKQWSSNRLQEDLWKAQHPDAKFNPYSGMGIIIIRGAGIYNVYPNQPLKFGESGSFNKLVMEKFNKMKDDKIF